MDFMPTTKEVFSLSLFNYLTYLSIEMAMRVKTEAATERIEMKLENLQYASPKGQSPSNMYTKLKTTLRRETIVSATLKFTMK